jgi:hypothetical protein
MSKIPGSNWFGVDVVAMQCDRCKTTHNDPMEIQEFLSWNDQCGFGNRTFGDLSEISIDLCQYCVKEVLGEWMVVEDTDTWGPLFD